MLGRARRVPVAIGRPFAECQCGAYVERAPFNEWDLLSPRVKLGFVGKEVALAVSFGLLPALLYLLFARLSGGGYETKRALMLVAAGLLGFGAFRLSRVGREIGRSRQRLGDPMYLAKLAEFGMASQARQ